MVQGDRRQGGGVVRGGREHQRQRSRGRRHERAGEGSSRGVRALFFYPTLILASFLVRILATARHPIHGLKSLTANWKRNILCIDMAVPPEAVPGYTRMPIPENFAQNFFKETILALLGGLLGYLLLGLPAAHSMSRNLSGGVDRIHPVAATGSTRAT